MGVNQLYSTAAVRPAEEEKLCAFISVREIPHKDRSPAYWWNTSFPKQKSTLLRIPFISLIQNAQAPCFTTSGFSKFEPSSNVLCRTCQSNPVLPPSPLQKELSPKQNTILYSSFPFPLPSNSCLPSTCPLCSPVLLLPRDMQTQGPSTIPALSGGTALCPVALPVPRTEPLPLCRVTSVDPRQAGLARPGGCRHLGLGQLLRAGSFGWLNNDLYLAAAAEGWAREALHGPVPLLQTWDR